PALQRGREPVTGRAARTHSGSDPRHRQQQLIHAPGCARRPPYRDRLHSRSRLAQCPAGRVEHPRTGRALPAAAESPDRTRPAPQLNCPALRPVRRRNSEETFMGYRLSKLYTRTGDAGTTGLAEGSRVPADSQRIEAMGTVDELNSSLGVLRAGMCSSALQPLVEALAPVEHRLF